MGQSGLTQSAAAAVIIAGLYLSADLLVPVVTAALLTFVLAGPVTWLERLFGRVLAPVVLVGVVLLAIVGSGWAVSRQLNELVPEIPRYRATLVEKVQQFRRASSGGVVDELSKTVEAVQQDLKADPSGNSNSQPAAAPAANPTPAVAERASGPSLFPWLGSLFSMAGTAAVTLTLTLFMLFERRDLRNRLVELGGRRNLALTTTVLDEAGGRVAKQLLMQAASSVVYGLILGGGLWLLDVPYPLVFGAVGAPLRFIPYVGPAVGGALPVLLTIATANAWSQVLWVGGFVLALELFTNLVVETMLYAGAAGVSQVALLVAVAFWSWLWGPMGLLLSVPLTVCVVVLGKHVPGWEFLATLMSEQQQMEPPRHFYQRLLAHDPDETLDLVERHVRANPPRSVYDALLVPALALAACDRAEGRITVEEAASVGRLLETLTPQIAELVQRAEVKAGKEPAPAAASLVRLGAYSAGDTLDAAAVALFVAAIDDLPVVVDVPSNLLASELASWVTAHDADVACIVDVSPGAGSRAGYALRRLRGGAAALPIMVGRWGGERSTATRDGAPLFAEASHVGISIEESRAYLRSMLPGLAPEAAPATNGTAAVAAATPVAPPLSA